MLIGGRRRWPMVVVLFFVFSTYLLYQNAASVPVDNPWRHSINAEIFPNIESTPVDSHGFLTPATIATSFCEAHNFPVYEPRETRRKVYDLFMVNTELDWLEVRLNELNDFVDYFVILESATTFTGLEKPLYVQENWKRFKHFHKKIILRVLDDSALQSTRTWDHEDLQRNAMFDQVLSPRLLTNPDSAGAFKLSKEQQPAEGDVIVVSDVDEIPKPRTLTILRNCQYPRRLTLRSRFYYYSFSFLHRGPEWPHPQATYYEGNDTIRPADLRNGEGSYGGKNYIQTQLDKADLWNSSWHCSTCFNTIEEVQTKMSSFSHTPLNQPAFRERSWIVNCFKEGLDLFAKKDQFYDKLAENWDIPGFLKSERVKSDRFDYMLGRDSDNANFKDYSIVEAQAHQIEKANLGRKTMKPAPRFLGMEVRGRELDV